MIKHIFRNRLLFFLFSFLLVFTSCRSVKETYQREEGLTDGIYRDAENQDTTNIAAVPWQEMFSDEVLQSLIDEAIQNNFDMQVAVARIKQASANFKQSKAELFPSLSANASAAYSSQGGLDDYDSAYGLSLSAAWEADIWGKLKSSKRAYLNSLLKSEAYKQAVQTQLIADVASYYYTLLAYDAKLNILEQSLKNYIEDVETMTFLKENNTVTGADLAKSEANRYSAEVSIPELKQSIKETENSLCLLLGRTPDSVKRNSLDEQVMTSDLNIGVPVQLLANRPDVQQAEYELKYYCEMTNVARAYFYPSLSITAEGGLSNTDLSDFFNASSVFSNFIAGLTSPIFNQRENRKRLEVAKAQQEEYLATFKQTVISAGIEVSNALYAYEVAAEKKEIRFKQIASLEKSVDYTKQLLQYTSTTNYTDVLTSEQNLLSAQLSAVNDQLSQLNAVIDLYRSLGGGVK